MRAVVKELGDRDLLLAGARADMERALREKHDAEQMLAKVIPPSLPRHSIYVYAYMYLPLEASNGLVDERACLTCQAQASPREEIADLHSTCAALRQEMAALVKATDAAQVAPTTLMFGSRCRLSIRIGDFTIHGPASADGHRHCRQPCNVSTRRAIQT